MIQPDEKTLRAVYNLKHASPIQFSLLVEWIKESRRTDMLNFMGLESDQKLHWIQGRMQTYDVLIDVMESPEQHIKEAEASVRKQKKAKELSTL